MSTIINRSEINITVDKKEGRITANAPITVKNQIQEIKTIDDIPGFNNTDREDGAVLIYNANTGLYDSKTYLGTTPLRALNFYVTTIHANNSVGNTGQVLTSTGTSVKWANAVNVAYIATLTANNTLFAYGKRESDLSVNFSQFTANANFAYVSNAATYATNSTFAYTANIASVAGTANNATFAYGKRESDLSVNFSQFTANANFAYVANDSTYATYLGGYSSSYYTNASNFTTGTLPSGRLPNTTVTPGSYGGASQIPVITVDQYGRITNAYTSAVAGVTAYNYSSSNNTFSIATGDGSVFRASIDTVNNLTVTGNLTISGTTTTVNTQNMIVKDSVIRLNDGQVTPLNDIGILMQRYAVANNTNYNVAVAWNEATKEFIIGKTPEEGNDNDISFSSSWVRFDEFGNAYVLLNIEAGNYVRAGSYMMINNVSFSEVSYPGTANSAVYFNGAIDEGEF